jgi:hypothetical protein
MFQFSIYISIMYATFTSHKNSFPFKPQYHAIHEASLSSVSSLPEDIFMKEILLFNIIIFIFFERGDVREQCMKISGNSSPVDQHNYFKNKNNEQDTIHNDIYIQ